MLHNDRYQIVEKIGQFGTSINVYKIQDTSTNILRSLRIISSPNIQDFNIALKSAIIFSTVCRHHHNLVPMVDFNVNYNEKNDLLIHCIHPYYPYNLEEYVKKIELTEKVSRIPII